MKHFFLFRVTMHSTQSTLIVLPYSSVCHSDCPIRSCV